MAHFYGTVNGRSKTRASRCGTRASGLRVSGGSWAGGVHVEFWYDDDTEHDMVDVRLVTWHGAGDNRLLYRGRCDGEPDRTTRRALAAIAQEAP